MLIQHLSKEISRKVKNTAEKTQADTWGNNGHCADRQYCHNTFVWTRTCSNGYVNIQPLLASEILLADLRHGLNIFKGQVVEHFFFFILLSQ